MAETKNGIEYPDNYDSVADIPSDLKKMAESIDKQIEKKVEKENGKGLSTNDFTNADKEKLDGLNNYDDTKIKEDITKIQEEQGKQNDDISTLKKQKEALEKEVQNLREDNKKNTLTEDNSGELINITNSTGSRFNSLKIEGNEKQDTREGYNLYNVKNLEKAAGQTVDEDDFITLEKTVAQSTGGYINAHLKISSLLKPITNYWLVIEVKENTGVSGFVLSQWLTETNSQIKTNVSPTADVRNPGIYKYAVTTMDDFTNVKYALRTFAAFNPDTTGKIVFRMSLLEQEPDLDTFKYEKYGSMPSFDYPSEIKTVGDNINVFNDEAYKGFVVTQQNYNALEKIDLKLENNKYYVAKIYFEDGTSVAVNNSNFMLYAYKADGKQSANIPNGIAKTYSNATELVKAKIVANATGLSAYANKVIKGIKIEEVDADGQPSPYSNYGQGCIELNIVNKNFLDIEKNASVKKGGVTVKTDENGVLTLNGTTTTNIYIKLNGKDIVDNNISNWKKSCFRKGTYKFTSEVLTATQAGNINAFLRKDVYETEGQYATIYQLMNAKTKTATANILEDTEAVVYLWIASGITLNNAKLKFQIELDNATEIVSNKEQNYIIPVQQRMFSGDKFVKVDGQWKEMHTIGTVFSKDVSNINVTNATEVSPITENFYRYNVNLGQIGRKSGTYLKILSNYFKYADSRWANKEGICGWESGQMFSVGTYNKNFDTPEKLKTFLTENNVEIDYKLAEPLYLDCTPEQAEILNKIEQEAHTYSEITNIYTEDEVGAVLKTNTAVDLKTVINNIQEQLIAE